MMWDMRRGGEGAIHPANGAEAVSSNQQPRDSVAPCIEDIAEPRAGGDTDRVVPAGGGGAEQAQGAVIVHGESRDRIGSSVDCHQPAAVLGQYNRALRTQPGAGPAPTRGEGSKRGEAAVPFRTEGQH